MLKNEKSKKREKVEKMLDGLEIGKKNIIAIQRDKNADYYYRHPKFCTKLDQLAIFIIRDGKSIYKFSSINNKTERVLLLIKNDNKLALIHGDDQIHSYGFENDNEEFSETVMIIYIYNCEANIIIASNRSEQFNHLITTYDTNFEATEHFISNIISDINKKEEENIDETNTEFKFNI